MNDQPKEEPKPTLDDALMDPELILFPRIAGEYPHHVVLRPQWLKSHSKYPCWIHQTGLWFWMTKPLEYAEEPIASPEIGLHEPLDETVRMLDGDFFSPEKSVPINPPGEIYLTANTAGEPTPLGMFASVKAAMAAFEEFWLANRSRIWETSHNYPEVVIEAPDWRRAVRNLQYPPEHRMIELIRAWLANMHSLGKPIIHTQFGSFLVHQPEAVSFYENLEYPGNDMLRLSDKNGEHLVSIAIEAVLEIDRAAPPRSLADPPGITFEAVQDPSLPPMG